MKATDNFVQPILVKIDKKDYYRVKQVNLEGGTIENWDFEVKDKAKESEIKEKAIKKYNQLVDDEARIIKTQIT